MYKPDRICAAVNAGVQRRLAMFLMCSCTEHTRVSSQIGCVPGGDGPPPECSQQGLGKDLFVAQERPQGTTPVPRRCA